MLCQQEHSGCQLQALATFQPSVSLFPVLSSREQTPPSPWSRRGSCPLLLPATVLPLEQNSIISAEDSLCIHQVHN